MIQPELSNQNQITGEAKPQKNIPELLAIILAFASVFVFFLKILFF